MKKEIRNTPLSDDVAVAERQAIINHIRWMLNDSGYPLSGDAVYWLARLEDWITKRGIRH